MGERILAQKYKDAKAFRAALEVRLVKQARETGMPINRIRKKVTFEAFLMRVAKSNVGLIAKGGFVMELRAENSRATKDLDFVLNKQVAKGSGPMEEKIRAVLDEVADCECEDFFEFRVGEMLLDLDVPTAYGGFRFHIESRLNNKVFEKFHLDVAIGDVVLTPTEKIKLPGSFSFAGIENATVEAVSKEQHFAEKIHTYTLPRDRENSRVKDLVDMVLLIHMGLHPAVVTLAIREIFQTRATHAIPKELPGPPESWRERYIEVTETVDLKVEFDEAILGVRDYLKKTIPTSWYD